MQVPTRQTDKNNQRPTKELKENRLKLTQTQNYKKKTRNKFTAPVVPNVVEEVMVVAWHGKTQPGCSLDVGRRSGRGTGHGRWCGIGRGMWRWTRRGDLRGHGLGHGVGAAQGAALRCGAGRRRGAGHARGLICPRARNSEMEARSQPGFVEDGAARLRMHMQPHTRPRWWARMIEDARSLGCRARVL